jgi:NAD(P)-dependent dehydrogenase (short-subunit alcohol dehydrogenase family)
MSDISFEGRVAVVTGAGRGLGRAYARLLAARGARVVVNDYNVAVDGSPGDPSESPAETVVAELRASGARAVSNDDSVADPQGAARMIAKAVDSFGRVDIVMNNAGVGYSDHIHEEPGPLFGVNMDTHLLGAIQVTAAALPHMAGQGSGRVLNVSSGAIFGSAWPDGNVLGAYALAKAASSPTPARWPGTPTRSASKSTRFCPSGSAGPTPTKADTCRIRSRRSCSAECCPRKPWRTARSSW